MKTDAAAGAANKTAKPFQRKLISRSDVKARSAVLKLKKRHVEVVTRLPTERLATACWAFIVVKRIGLEAAPVLVFRPLQRANMESFQQDIHKLVPSFGLRQKATEPRQKQPVKAAAVDQILALSRCNPGSRPIEVKDH